MAATDEQLHRARAALFAREYRVHIGPRRPEIDETLFTLGEPVTLPTVTETTATVFAHSTTIPVISTSGYPTSGMVVLRANTPHASWWSYTGTTATSFTGAAFAHGYGHAFAGTRVEVWSDISDRITASPTGSEWREGPLYLWRYDLAGIGYDSNLMLPDASVLIEERFSPADELWGRYTPWRVAAIGFVRTWRAEGDADTVRRWSASVESLWTYLAPHRVTARRYGRTNLAEGASVTASSNLANPLAETGEFLGSLGSTDAANVADTNDDTLYISEVAPSYVAETPGSSGASELIINEVMLAPLPGVGTLQYIEIRLPPDSPYYASGLNVHSYALTTGTTSYVNSNVSGWPREVVGGSGYIRLPEITLTEDNDRLILTNDGARLRRTFNVSGSVEVFDWRELPGFSRDALPARDLLLGTSGDVLHLRPVIPNVAQDVIDMVGIGTVASFWNGANDQSRNGAEWNDPTTVALPSAGSSVRRVPTCLDTDQASDWQTEANPNPADNRTSTDPVHISLELDNIPTALAENMTALAPAAGAWLALDSADYLRATGTIQIDAEQISYIARTDTAIQIGARAQGGTTAAVHTAGALVSIVTAGLGAHRYPTVESVELRRWRRIGLTYPVAGGAPGQGPVVPHVWEIWISREPTPRYPGTANWELDWFSSGPVVVVSGGAATRQRVALPTIFYAKHILIRVRKMSDNGRAKLNEIYVWRLGLSGTYNGETGAGTAMRALLEEVVSSDRITIEDDTFEGTTGDVVIADGPLGALLGDLLGEHLTTLRLTRDGRVVVARDPFHPLGPRPAAYATLDEPYLRSPQQATHVSRLGVGQVVVRATNLATGERYEGRFPPQPGPGEIEEHELRAAVGSTEEAARLAQALYLADERISRRYDVTTAGPLEGVQAGDRVLLLDVSDDRYPEGRLLSTIVQGVTHGGEDGAETLDLQEWRAP